MQILLIYTTHNDEEAAWRIANILMERRLIACVNIIPIQSAYWWHGQVENEDEWVALFKTLPELESKVEATILKYHPYDTPCVIRWRTEANESFGNWIASCVTPVNTIS